MIHVNSRKTQRQYVTGLIQMIKLLWISKYHLLH